MYIKQLPKPKPWKSAEEIETTDSNWKKRTDVHHADVRGRLNGYLTTLGEMLWMVDGLPLDQRTGDAKHAVLATELHRIYRELAKVDTDGDWAVLVKSPLELSKVRRGA